MTVCVTSRKGIRIDGIHSSRCHQSSDECVEQDRIYVLTGTVTQR